MDVLIVFVCGVKGERDGTESTEAISVKEGFQGVDTCHDHIDSHIEFVAIYQKWVLDVFLNDNWLSVCNLTEVIDERNASSSAFGCGLHDPVVKFPLLIF